MENDISNPPPLKATTTTTIGASTSPKLQEEISANDVNGRNESLLIIEESEKTINVTKEEEDNEEGNPECLEGKNPIDISKEFDIDIMLGLEDSSPKGRRASTSILPQYRGNTHKQDKPDSQWKGNEIDENAVLPLLSTYRVCELGGYDDINLFVQDVLPRLTSIVATIISITKVKQQGSFVFMYTVQVCKKTTHGSLEIHLVSRSLKSFHDLHKSVNNYFVII